MQHTTQSESPRDPGADPLGDVDAFDVVVIGAGIAGAAAAWTLAEHMHVVLVERESGSWRARDRTVGVRPLGDVRPPGGVHARPRQPSVPRTSSWMGSARHRCSHRVGWRGSASDEDADRLDTFAASARRLTPTVRRLSPEATLELLPGFRPAAVAGGAAFEPEAMSIDTAALLQGFVAGARRRGATVLTTSEAISAVRTASAGSRWVTSVGARHLTSTHVVNAAGAWGDVVAERCGVAPIGLQPLRRTAAIVPAPEWVGRWPLVMDIAGRYYVEPEAGGLLVSPADETVCEPCDARPEEIDVALALDQLAAATEVPVRSVRRAWAGLRTFAPDRVPVLGEDPAAPGFWWLVGQGGAGIKTSPAMAALLTAQMTGVGVAFDDAASLTRELSPQRFR